VVVTAVVVALVDPVVIAVGMAAVVVVAVGGGGGDGAGGGYGGGWCLVHGACLFRVNEIRHRRWSLSMFGATHACVDHVFQGTVCTFVCLRSGLPHTSTLNSNKRRKVHEPTDHNNWKFITNPQTLFCSEHAKLCSFDH
jgi:hypothetical protein